MSDLLRDTLELELVSDIVSGDTTVLSMLLHMIPDSDIFNSLGDANQLKLQELMPHLKFYYEIHITGKNGFSTTVISTDELDDDEVILKAYADDILSGDDCHHVDYVQLLSYSDWDTHFNFNK